MGFAYTSYFDQRFKGHFYRLGLDIAEVNLNNSSGDKGKSIFFFPYYELGYLFPSPTIRWGFSCAFIYSLGQVQGIIFPYSGLNIQPKFTISYAF